ncbi:hypothetical protein N7448_008132 [Penicillium atrosanguineum]|uniref:ketoacyl-synt-domain-containing protein n=1 Tax=Penicillium atrosanguineum TaxID=1132637 RepID=UPI002387C797|nr:ketoacyl-synt-domain-containing protein [Penicillium atrosanguineum]KAJ5127353.1 hypothetical protein N7448_008132 [Penicillium atrosanguineum]KAJ5147554.1 hypothetical protein N7526_000906 [Penicillium atrosanguineum]KAJ5313969.1 ketoacyl-synt-domain-containing protein [Penicillium atrosanguineum]
MGRLPDGLPSLNIQIMTHPRSRDRNARYDRGLGFPVSLELSAKPDHNPDPAATRGIFYASGTVKLYCSPSPRRPADSFGGSGGSWRSATDMHGSTGEPMLNTGADAGGNGITRSGYSFDLPSSSYTWTKRLASRLW